MTGAEIPAWIFGLSVIGIITLFFVGVYALDVVVSLFCRVSRLEDEVFSDAE